jgi:hypothetical protein
LLRPQIYQLMSSLIWLTIAPRPASSSNDDDENGGKRKNGIVGNRRSAAKAAVIDAPDDRRVNTVRICLSILYK